MTYLELELTEEEIKERLNVIQDKIEAIKNNKPFKRNFEAVEETFRGKKTGNKHLSKTCSFCEYKNSCWDDLEYKPQPASSAVNPPWHYYTEIAKATA